MSSTKDIKKIDLANGRVVSGAICAAFVPAVFFVILSIIESHDVFTINFIMLAVFSLVPGFLSIFVPCFALLWFGKTKPGWFAVVPAMIIVPQLYIYNPSQGYLSLNPTVDVTAMIVAALGGLLCWFISVRLDPNFRNKT